MAETNPSPALLSALTPTTTTRTSKTNRTRSIRMKDPPSRERVSAAIAMVRARQAATTGMHDEEDKDNDRLSPSKRSLTSPPSPEILRNSLVKGGTGTTRAPITPKQFLSASSTMQKSQMLSPSSSSTQAPQAAAKQKSPPLSFFFNVFSRRTGVSKSEATEQEKNAPTSQLPVPPPPPLPPRLVIPPPPPTSTVSGVKRVQPHTITESQSDHASSPDASARARRLASIRARVLARREERNANSSTTSTDAPPHSATIAALLSPRAGEGMKRYMQHWEHRQDPKDLSPPKYPVLMDSELSRESAADESSDEEEDIPHVDPDTLANVTRFIDALHQQQAPSHKQQPDKTTTTTTVSILETMSSESGASLPDTAGFDPDILQGLGNLIDKLQQKPKTTQAPVVQNSVVDRDCPSEEDDEPELTNLPTYQQVYSDYSATFTESTHGEVQPETLAHIVAYIDSLANVPKPVATLSNGTTKEIVELEEDKVDPPHTHQSEVELPPDFSTSAAKLSSSRHNSSGHLQPDDENEENEQRGNFDLKIVSTESKTTMSILETRMEEYMLDEPSTSSSDDSPEETLMEMMDFAVELATGDGIASQQVIASDTETLNLSVNPWNATTVQVDTTAPKPWTPTTQSIYPTEGSLDEPTTDLGDTLKSEPALMLQSLSKVSTATSRAGIQIQETPSIADHQEEDIGKFIDSLNMASPEQSTKETLDARSPGLHQLLERDVNGKLAFIKTSSSLPSLKIDGSVSSTSLHLFEQDVNERLATMDSVTETAVVVVEAKDTTEIEINQHTTSNKIAASFTHTENQELIIGAFIDSLNTVGSNSAPAVGKGSFFGTEIVTTESNSLNNALGDERQLHEEVLSESKHEQRVVDSGRDLVDPIALQSAAIGIDVMRDTSPDGKLLQDIETNESYDPIALARSKSSQLHESFSPEVDHEPPCASKESSGVLTDPVDLSGISHLRSFLLAVGSNDSDEMSAELDLAGNDRVQAAAQFSSESQSIDPIKEKCVPEPVTSSTISTQSEPSVKEVFESEQEPGARGKAMSPEVEPAGMDNPSVSFEQRSSHSTAEKTCNDVVVAAEDGETTAQGLGYSKVLSVDSDFLPAIQSSTSEGVFRAAPLTAIEDEKKDDSTLDAEDDENEDNDEDDSIESIKYVQVGSFDSSKVLPITTDDRLGTDLVASNELFGPPLTTHLDGSTTAPIEQNGAIKTMEKLEELIDNRSGQNAFAVTSTEDDECGEISLAEKSKELVLVVDEISEIQREVDEEFMSELLDEQGCIQIDPGLGSSDTRVSCTSSRSRSHLLGEDIFKASTSVSIDQKEDSRHNEIVEDAANRDTLISFQVGGDASETVLSQAKSHSNHCSSEASVVSRSSRSSSTDEEFSVGRTTHASREISGVVGVAIGDAFIEGNEQALTQIPREKKSIEEVESFDSSRASSVQQRSSVAEFTQNLRLVGTFAINPRPAFTDEAKNIEASSLFNIARESERLDLLVHSLLQATGSEESSKNFPYSTSKCTSDELIEHLQLSSYSSNGVEQGYEVDNNVVSVANRGLAEGDVEGIDSALDAGSLSSPLATDLPEAISLPLSDTDIGLHSEVFQAANVVVESMKLADQLLHDDGDGRLGDQAELSSSLDCFDFDDQLSDELCDIEADVTGAHRNFTRRDLTIDTGAAREDETQRENEEAILSTLLDKLNSPQGASKEELALLNEFTKVAAPILKGSQPSAVEEARIRQASQRAGLPAHFVDHVLDIASLRNLELTQTASTSTIGGSTPKHMKKAFDHIPDVDETENIMAFFRRFAALTEGGHFPDANIEALGSFGRISNVGDEVEVDAVRGFVRKEFEPSRVKARQTEPPLDPASLIKDVEGLSPSSGRNDSTTKISNTGDALGDILNSPEPLGEPSLSSAQKSKYSSRGNVQALDGNAELKQVVSSFSVDDRNTQMDGVGVEVDDVCEYERNEIESIDSFEPISTDEEPTCQLLETEMAISELLDRLSSPEGASDDEIEHLNEFVKVATPILKGSQPSPIEEALIRQASRRAGLPVHFVDQVLDLATQRNLTVRQSASSSTAGGSTPKHLKKMFEEIPDVDESENIAAFLRRFASLEAGGHFPNANIEALGPFGRLSKDGDEVEVDIHRGYVRKEYEQVRNDREEISEIPESDVPQVVPTSEDATVPGEAVNPAIIEKTRTRQLSERVGLPLQVVEKLIDRALERSSVASTSPSAEASTPKHQKKVFDDISDVDENENISAFLNRLSALKAGGHFPDLNLENLESFLTTSSDGDAVEIDLKCGFVKKHLAETDLEAPTRMDTLSPLSNEVFSVASDDGVQQLNAFVGAVAPLLKESQPSAVEEAQIRQAAQQAGIPLDVVDKVMGESAASAARITPDDDDTENNILSEYDEIEEVDENEAIDAFLHRFTALKQGGHFPDGSLEALGQLGQLSPVNDEAVEIDVAHGFVRKDDAPCMSDDEPWWQDDDAKADEDKHSNTGVKRYESLATVIARQMRANEPETPRDPIQMSRGGRYDSAEDWDLAGVKAMPEISSKTGNKVQLSNDPLHGFETTKDVSTFFLELESRNSNPDEWIIKERMATYGNPFKKNWLSRSVRIGKPKPINGVAAAVALTRPSQGAAKRQSCGGPRHWKRSYKQRTRNHPGYFNVDVYSLYETSLVARPPHPLDSIPWESRDVRQRFLQEQSITFCRNWFGKLVRFRGNDRNREPVCHPKSMEMPHENYPHPGEWTEEWYTTWKRPRDQEEASSEASSHASDSEFDESEGSSVDEDDDSTQNSGTKSDKYTKCSASNAESDDDDSSASSSTWEDIPECGHLRTVKLRIGEHISRVHPNFTSSLRRSRWRLKYFPRGTFPY